MNILTGIELKLVENYASYGIGEIKKVVLKIWPSEHSCLNLNAGNCANDEEVNAPVQYGQRVRATVVYLMNYQHLPFKRTSELFDALFGLLPLQLSSCVVYGAPFVPNDTF